MSLRVTRVHWVQSEFIEFSIYGGEKGSVDLSSSHKEWGRGELLWGSGIWGSGGSAFGESGILT